MAAYSQVFYRKNKVTMTSATLEQVVKLFYTGKLEFGNLEHIKARNVIRGLRRGTQDFARFQVYVSKFKI